MCRHKPGPRCHSHAARSYESAVRRLAKARHHLNSVRPRRGSAPKAYQEAQDRVDAASRNLTVKQANLDATRTGQRSLADDLKDPDLSEYQRQKLLRRREVGALLRESRRDQVGLMPEPPGPDAPTAASAAYDALGRQRERLSLLDVQFTHADDDQMQRIQTVRAMAEDDVFTADVEYRQALCDGGPDVQWLSQSERDVCERSSSALLRRQVTRLSHMRAAANSGAHPERMDDSIARSEAALADRASADVIARNQPSPTVASQQQAPPWREAKRRPKGRWNTANRSRSKYGPGALGQKALDELYEELTEVESGKYLRNREPLIPEM